MSVSHDGAIVMEGIADKDKGWGDSTQVSKTIGIESWLKHTNFLVKHLKLKKPEYEKEYYALRFKALLNKQSEQCPGEAKNEECNSPVVVSTDWGGAFYGWGIGKISLAAPPRTCWWKKRRFGKSWSKKILEDCEADWDGITSGFLVWKQEGDGDRTVHALWKQSEWHKAKLVETFTASTTNSEYHCGYITVPPADSRLGVYCWDANDETTPEWSEIPELSSVSVSAKEIPTLFPAVRF
jgi:hypothetical protein